MIRDSVPMAEAVGDDGVGPVVVDVDLDHVLVARRPARSRRSTRGGPGSRGRRGRGRASGGAGRRSRSRRRSRRRARATASAVAAVAAAARRARRDAVDAGLGLERTPARRRERALEQPEQALAAGVDDVRLAQDRQQRRGLRDGALGRVDRRGEHRHEVVVALGLLHGGRRRLADDGEDRALDRPGDGLVGLLRAGVEGVREVEAVEPALAGERPPRCRRGSGWRSPRSCRGRPSAPRSSPRGRSPPRRRRARPGPPHRAPPGRWPACSCRCRRRGPGRR